MKLIIALIFPLLMGCGNGMPIEKINTEVSFFDGTLIDGLNKAKADKKLVFVEFYTDWCGSCKKMFSSTLTDKTVGTYMNENFINLKINLEKGEGPSLKSEFNIEAFPASFIFDANGKVVKSHVGRMSVDEFLIFVKSI